MPFAVPLSMRPLHSSKDRRRTAREIPYSLRLLLSRVGKTKKQLKFAPERGD
jgi:hypothetical protein